MLGFPRLLFGYSKALGPMCGTLLLLTNMNRGFSGILIERAKISVIPMLVPINVLRQMGIQKNGEYPL